jgi:hypothetical protein
LIKVLSGSLVERIVYINSKKYYVPAAKMFFTFLGVIK